MKNSLTMYTKTLEIIENENGGRGASLLKEGKPCRCYVYANAVKL